MRSDGRSPDRLRKVKITRNYLKHAEGSVLIEMGDTRVVCAVSVEEKIPPFLKNTGKGWITAEYAMLPRATETRSIRESIARTNGRNFEIQRLIGRSLRSISDLNGFGERTMWVDCDVIQADGGTRAAAITGAYVALVDAFNTIKGSGMIEEIPIMDSVAAVSVGRIGGNLLLDMNYEEDVLAEVDVNFVVTGAGNFVEVQGTAEESSFTKQEMDEMTILALKGVRELARMQRRTLHWSP
ncbi:MAG: ribonuclease PH [Syntrophobacterales bacterium]|nr:MAG: ribonuclease PH [Syntrophobacterales bacterium]